MLPFSLSRVPAISFGAGRAGRVGEDAAAAGIGAGAVLVVVDPSLLAFAFVESGLTNLRDHDFEPVVFSDITSDPKEHQVEAACRMAREAGCGGVVAIGGGSALDAAKVAAVACHAEGPLSRYRLAAESFATDRLPIVAVPTTAGTGSEATSVSILSSGDGTKYWFWSPDLKPDRVVLDPVAGVGLPPHLTAATGLDAIVHAMEAATNRAAHPAIDHYAHAAIRLGRESLPRAVKDGGDLDARGAMLLAACYAGVAIDNAGTALAHCAGHALGSLAAIHHGRAVALAMAGMFGWIMEGEEHRFEGTAAAFGVEACNLPSAFADFVRSLPVAPLKSEQVRPSPEALAERMAAPENHVMRTSTARTVGDDDLHDLAERVLAFA